MRWACAGEGASLDFKGPQQELHTWDRGEAALIHVERGGMRVGREDKSWRRCHVDGEEALIPATVAPRTGLVIPTELAGRSD